MADEQEIVTERLRQRARELRDKGDLLSEQKLAEFYGNFAERFGPRQLQSLDGERLLNTLHDVTDKNGLPYWLEFKNDQEFVAKQFGSIAGGSALKFGMFKKKETGAWTTGSSNAQTQVTPEAAIEIARKHRDQLVGVCALLDALPDDGSDATYANLQKGVEATAPNLYDLAWAHKYFSLLYPSRLDDFHMEAYQRFHLIRALQLPPQGAGRYICAGRFVKLARSVGLPIKSLAFVMYVDAPGPYRYWRIGTRDGADGPSVWPEMREGHYVSVGWSDLGNLSWLLNEDPHQWTEKLRPVLVEKYSGSPANVVTKWTKEIASFLRPERIRDIVVAADGTQILGIGRIKGNYEYDAKFRFPHLRRVEWLSIDSWKPPLQEGLLTTFCELKKHEENRLEVERRILVPAEAPSLPDPVTKPAAEALLLLEPEIEEVQRLLSHKPQIILYGPPGTGKTFWARKAAYELASRANFGVAYNQLSDAQRKQLLDTDDGYVRMCSFHAGYGYEDFLEGYRPKLANGSLFFEEKTGIFKKLCHDGQTAGSRSYYLIIDEINRGDLPRIFGELMTVLEKDKRGDKVILPISGRPFWVPNNVFIIATMNTADRSISLLDVALRRRFGFIEIPPRPGLLKTVIQGLPIGLWLEAVNERIRALVGADARNLQLGHSYFMPNGQQVRSLQEFTQIFRYEVFPLLEEYCYGRYEVLEKIFGKSLVDLPEQRLRIELFEKGHDADLVTALLGGFPALITTQAAVSEEAMPDEDVEKDDDR